MKKEFLTAVIAGSLSALSVSSAVAEGNRYDLDRLYHSDVSAAEAYVLTQHSRGNRSGSEFSNAVIIDVRTVEEYAAGHPENAYNIPFPHIQARPGDADYLAQDPAQFVADVSAAIPDKSTPIMTLCRTGHRSVLAANLLADAGYEQVRNIWQGFVGRTKTDTAGNTLDLNNNGELGDLGDKDGWSGYQNLPYSTALTPNRMYLPYASLYYD